MRQPFAVLGRFQGVVDDDFAGRFDELYGVVRRPPPGRPWVGICMIASVDGTTVVDGRSGGLGNSTDGR